MPKVYNWQIGRRMEYPFEESHPKKQFAFVFNTNRCIACQTCTMACKTTWTFSKGQEAMWWNNVETKPYGGYPLGWDVKILRMLEESNPGGQTWDPVPEGEKAPYGYFEGDTIFEAKPKDPSPRSAGRVMGYLPTDAEWATPNIYEDTPKGPKGTPGAYDPDGTQLPVHKTWFFYLQRICNHCTYPGCLAACPRQAIYKRPEDGIVLIDQERCRGYRKCVEGCPYKKAMYRGTTRVSEKCVACYPRIEGRDPESDGVPMETRCMTACIGHIRLQGLVDVNPDGSWKEDPENPIYHLVKVARVALPLYPQLGTEPNGYYIPPRWVPREYLVQMFGPGVDQAIEAYTYPSRETLAVLQLFRTTTRIIFRYEIKKGPKVFEREVRGRKLEIYDDTVIGYDAEGRVCTQVNVEEPLLKRPEKHLNSI